MMVNNHLIVATAVFLAGTEYLTQGNWTLDATFAFHYVVTMVGVLLPDIDHPKSFIGSRVKWASYPIWVIFGHRGLMHSIWPVLAIFLLAQHMQIPWLSYLGLGALLHLLGDFMTPSGVPLFYPARKNLRCYLTVPTDSYAENIVALGSLMLSIVYLTA